MSLHDELKSTNNYGLNEVESSSEFKQLRSMRNVLKLELSNSSSKVLDSVFGLCKHFECSRLYLQQMLELEKQYPWVYSMLNGNGNHKVRRSNKYWTRL